AGQRQDDYVARHAPAEAHQGFEVAEIDMTGNGPARPVDAAIVEDAADADVAMGIGVECLQQTLAGRPGAVDDGTPREAALRQTTPRQGSDGRAVADEADGAAHIPQSQPGEKSGATLRKKTPASIRATVAVQPNIR